MAPLKNQTELDELYGGLARRYDLVNAVMSLGLDGSVRRGASARVRPGRILDVGTGTGISARGLLAANPGSFVVGVDRSPEMLKIARAAGGGPYVQGDVRKLPFADGVFDGAGAGFVFRPLEGDAAAIREIYRVLKPGGRLVVYDTLGVPRGPVGLFYRILLAFYVPLCGFILANDSDAYLYFARSVRESITAERLAVAFRNAGFSSVKIERKIFGTVTILTADKGLDP